MTRQTGWSPDETEELDGARAPEDDLSTVKILQRAFSEGRNYVAAEVERQGLRARLIGSAARDAAILVVIALFLLIGALVALLIGAIWALAPQFGVFAATAIVVGGTIFVILLLVIGARIRMRSAIRIAFDKEEE